MRRILLVLTAAALMAAMMVSAGPAKADITNDNVFISSNSTVDSVEFGDVTVNGWEWGFSDWGSSDWDVGDDDDSDVTFIIG